MLVSLVQARAQIISDASADDAHVTLLIKASSRAVMNYVNANTDDFTDSAGDAMEDSAGIAIDVPEDIKLAALYLVGWFYRNRDSDPDGEMPAGFMPAPVVSLLTYYHDPALA